MTIELLRQLIKAHPQCEFVLLTSSLTHDELACLDAPNVKRELTRVISSAQQHSKSLAKRIAARIPGRIRRRLAGLYFRFQKRQLAQVGEHLLENLQADLLFAPFTAPYYSHPRIPTVGVIYDLQYLSYPQFFTPEEIAQREQTFNDVCARASQIICISDCVRQTVIEHGSADPIRVHTVHIQLPHRLPAVMANQQAAILNEVGLTGEYLLYPANFWPHKNHEMLLTAFGMFLSRHPDTNMKLVCTGAASARRDKMIAAASNLGLGERLVFPGYLDDAGFAALLHGCAAVIYPSLYEGFGMPIVEAMAAGKPVLCSAVTSIPEVGGDAAIYFNPKRPDEIVRAMETLVLQPEEVAHRVELGKVQAEKFSHPKEMASLYWTAFGRAMKLPLCKAMLAGLHGDGWCGGEFSLHYGPAMEERFFKLTVFAPDWLPADVSIVDRAGSVFQIKRGEPVSFSFQLPATAGLSSFRITPEFCPQTLGIGADARILTCMIQSAAIVGAGGTAIQQFWPEQKL
jgi:glycosyltransferase involved in cell wall biosynthesis